MEKYLEFRNIYKKYPGNEEYSLNNFNLDVCEGEFIVLVGPSGCGKSTTLKVLSGLEEISSGEILINEEIVNYFEPKDRNIAMVFQNYGLYPHFNVEKNITFGLNNTKKNKEQIATDLKKVCESLQITKIMNEKPGNLSGGQQQRVALGRAIIREPKIYLFDEPLSNLDVKLRVKTRLEILKMHKKLNKTFFYVTHDQVEAMTMADRIVVMNEGKVMQVGTPMEIYFKPKNLFVAKFIGSPEMNVFEVKYSNDKLTFLGHELNLEDDLLEKIKNTKEDEFYLGVRSQDILISERNNEGFMKCEVETIENLGSEIIYYIKVPGYDELINVSLPFVENGIIYDNLYISLNSNKKYIFSKETENNILL